MFCRVLEFLQTVTGHLLLKERKEKLKGVELFEWVFVL